MNKNKDHLFLSNENPPAIKMRSLSISMQKGCSRGSSMLNEKFLESEGNLIASPKKIIITIYYTLKCRTLV
jgi:hypothetical protein